jgi:uncharacterized membrane protein (UPF0127 family)
MGDRTTLIAMFRLVVVLLIVIAAGCDSGFHDPTFDSIASDSTTATTTLAPTTARPPSVPDALSGFDLATVRLDDAELLVAVADDSSERRQGLMNLDDLGDLDGMLFVFDGDVSDGFWMKNTLIPLDIAFFTAGGDIVDQMVMAPCTADPCPTYHPGGAYRYALEMPAGAMPDNVQHIEIDL